MGDDYKVVMWLRDVGIKKCVLDFFFLKVFLVCIFFGIWLFYK